MSLAPATHTDTSAPMPLGHPEALRTAAGAQPCAQAPLFRRALAIFLEGMRAERNLFHALTEALARGLGWRWAAVTRFQPDAERTVQMLAWWSDGHFHQPLDYAIEHTPCERVAASGGFCYFDQVAQRFPRDHFALEHRVLSYAGQVYYDGNGNALGHLLAAHDAPADDVAELRELFDLLTLMVGLELRHRDAAERALGSERAARTDPLTGLGNRRAFDAALAELALARPLGLQLAIIDLDGLKRVNDRLGHEAGDALLRCFARELQRLSGPHESLFRLGGDEFAMLAIASRSRLKALFAAAEEAWRRALAATPWFGSAPAALDSLGLSYGLAEPRQFRWDFLATAAEADQRMYAHKRARRAA